MFDSLVRTATQALSGNAKGGSALDVIQGLIQDHGGLGGLLGQLRDSGLGAQVDSWIGTGQNLPVSAQSIIAALGQGKIAEIARSLGVDPQQAAAHLADVLPKAVDHLTPNGQLPAEDAIASALQLLRTRSGA
jgi:uncharacterized protein YidB (DUF937 family)